MFRLMSIAFLIGLAIGFVPAMAQTPPAAAPRPHAPLARRRRLAIRILPVT